MVSAMDIHQADIKIYNPEFLYIITSITHEMPFDVGDVEALSDKMRVVIPFRYCSYASAEVTKPGILRREYRAPVFCGLLSIHHVVGWTIRDPDNLRRHLLTRIDFDEQTSVLRIGSDTPLTFQIEVDYLDMAVTIGREFVGWKGFRQFGPCGLPLLQSEEVSVDGQSS